MVKKGYTKGQLKFGGKTFAYHGSFQRKFDATQRAFILRLEGWNVRVVKRKRRQAPWLIYKRRRG